MHLKSLTLKGFKSFAGSTTLRFEPGITAVVGPNGSGKSNVVDAIAWVLGEQGAKALRGGKMEDVIFAGTAGRPPLGRAEVTLTIDNSDNALPIEYTEVSLTRRMFREGHSEYEINGESARLLDIQELLSDSGIGREMHVIVGQGQLDSVLQARPEDRRGFIEEAAGVLKHRKRKEKALRKLDAMQANLTRLGDLTTELRRQLKPLGKQAEIARRAAGVQAELRDSRLRLLADDLTRLRDELAREVADEEAIRTRRTAVEQALEEARQREGGLEAQVAADAPRVTEAQDTYYRLAALQERLRSTATLAGERARHLVVETDEELPTRDPDALEAEAADVLRERAVLEEELAGTRAALAAAAERREASEHALAEAEHALVVATRAFADRREGLATLTGKVNALRTRAAAGVDEIARLSAAAVDARSRAENASTELGRLQQEVGALDDGEYGLDEQHEAAVAAHTATVERVRELAEAERAAERDRSTWSARADALAVGLAAKDGAGAVLEAGDRLPGVIGSLAGLLTIEPGHEAAVAAALGELADAVAVTGPDPAARAVDLLKTDGAGRAVLLVGGGRAQPVVGEAPSGSVWARAVVTAPETIRAAVDAALADVVIVDDLAAAQAVVAARPELSAVTRDGDAVGAHWTTGGSASAPSAIEVQVAADEAQAKASEAAERHDRLHAELQQARAEAAEHEQTVAAALAQLNESDARLSAVAGTLAELGQQARSAGAEGERLDLARTVAEQARDADLAGLGELEERLTAAQAAGEDAVEPDPGARDDLRVALADVRQEELAALLAVRTGEERVQAAADRAEQLLRAAQAERIARQRHAERQRARAQAAVVAAAVRELADRVLLHVAESVATADTERSAAQASRVAREQELHAVRGEVRELAAELAQLTDAVHRDEVLRAEQRLRIEQLETRAAEEYGIELESLLAEYGPDQPCPPSSIETAEYEQAKERGEEVVAPQPGPFHRPTQEKRAARAERDLALLGKVNPLALEEFAALEERHQFLSTQLEDLKATRRDLLTVVREVDERILQVFTSAYYDVAREFEVVFATLFPGGEGRLVLTDPDDMLLTGIEVEARPPGKKVKRLSLLSGGERSLTAVALLVAIFRARPSPFYVLDEVEAALDDVNLGRLVSLVAELRASSQLIIITHQKRTMEVADALYGVAMRGDGVTHVISQRLTDTAGERVGATVE